jgi:hypothetical protein
VHSALIDNPLTAKARVPRSRVLYVVLIALAWLQLSWASHQFEHVAGDLSDVCTVCSQLERLDHAIAEGDGIATILAIRSPAPEFLAGISYAEFIVHYHSRAPPTV